MTLKKCLYDTDAEGTGEPVLIGWIETDDPRVADIRVENPKYTVTKPGEEVEVHIVALDSKGEPVPNAVMRIYEVESAHTRLRGRV